MSEIGLITEESEALRSLFRYAMIDCPVFESQLYRTLTGLDFDRSLFEARAWLDGETPSFDLTEILRRTLLALVSFPHRSWDQIKTETGVSKKEARRIYVKLKNLDGLPE